MSNSRKYFTVAADLLLIKGDQILLSRRFNTGYEDGNYHVVGGHVELGETVTQALIRETKEEIGIDIAETDLKFVHVVNRGAEGGWFDFFFVAQIWQGEPTNCEPHRCDDLSWFGLDKLPDNIVPYARHAIEQYLKQNPYSEFGW